MSLWPNVITALVGVAGIAGSILTAQLTASRQTRNLMLSLGEEKKSVQLADRKHANVGFMATVNEFSIGTIGAYQAEPDPEKRRNIILKALPERSAIYSRLSELELIAPENVRSEAREVVNLNLDLMDQLMQDAGTSGISAIGQAEERLFAAIRADLGIEPAERDPGVIGPSTA